MIRQTRSALATILLVACSGAGSPAGPVAGTPAAIEVEAGDDQRAVVSTSIRPSVRVVDEDGVPVAGVTVTFDVGSGDGWVTANSVRTNGSGRASTNWYVGPRAGESQTLQASAGSGLSVTFDAATDPLQAGVTYEGADGYVAFTAGDLPLIVSAPHGGTLQPASIPDRSGAGAVTVRDANTDLLAASIATAFDDAIGGTPHTVIVHLARIKLDANREIVEAAEGNTRAEQTWREFHGFLRAAREHVAAAHDRGFFIDVHGHGHEIQRLELGYLLTANDLAGDDDALNSSAFTLRSSVRTLASTGTAIHAELIRGATSLGTLFEQRGYPAVPSQAQPDPDGAPYFTGGYNTREYSSRNGGTIDGVQIEANFTGVRDTSANREEFADALADAVIEFFATHYGVSLGSGS